MRAKGCGERGTISNEFVWTRLRSLVDFASDSYSGPDLDVDALQNLHSSPTAPPAYTESTCNATNVFVMKQFHLRFRT
ncbi:hypothetical protein EVAR_90168_1 [Eumeta japonica]|uniref:Uncharacterized protein n=1 Tax=Eumeta variegata TaxID=151549 RepID=A0A4C1WYF5_EUMVA|nr:hypothetical protein EVAR_90168_1 [Eumeta japonica]